MKPIKIMLTLCFCIAITGCKQKTEIELFPANNTIQHFMIPSEPMDEIFTVDDPLENELRQYQMSMGNDFISFINDEQIMSELYSKALADEDQELLLADLVKSFPALQEIYDGRLTYHANQNFTGEQEEYEISIYIPNLENFYNPGPGQGDWTELNPLICLGGEVNGSYGENMIPGWYYSDTDDDELPSWLIGYADDTLDQELPEWLWDMMDSSSFTVEVLLDDTFAYLCENPVVIFNVTDNDSTNDSLLMQKISLSTNNLSMNENAVSKVTEDVDYFITEGKINMRYDNDNYSEFKINYLINKNGDIGVERHNAKIKDVHKNDIGDVFTCNTQVYYLYYDIYDNQQVGQITDPDGNKIYGISFEFDWYAGVKKFITQVGYGPVFHEFKWRMKENWEFYQKIETGNGTNLPSSIGSSTTINGKGYIKIKYL